MQLRILVVITATVEHLRSIAELIPYRLYIRIIVFPQQRYTLCTSGLLL